MDWPAWFEAAGLPAPSEAGTRFSQADHAIDAALGGAGVVLGRISLCEGHVRDGALVMPLPLSLRPGTRFSLVCPKGSETRPQVARFADWVREETRPIAALAEGRVFA
jgi:LysR family glycine cleavage system transcriptional activator